MPDFRGLLPLNGLEYRGSVPVKTHSLMSCQRLIVGVVTREASRDRLNTIENNEYNTDRSGFLYRVRVASLSRKTTWISESKACNFTWFLSKSHQIPWPCITCRNDRSHSRNGSTERATKRVAVLQKLCKILYKLSRRTFNTATIGSTWILEILKVCSVQNFPGRIVT